MFQNINSLPSRCIYQHMMASRLCMIPQSSETALSLGRAQGLARFLLDNHVQRSIFSPRSFSSIRIAALPVRRRVADEKTGGSIAGSQI